MIEINIKKINELKEKKDAVILAHYYVEEDVQKVADYVGDSYYLSKIAAQTSHKTILFCGVSFMAESAKTLSPSKTVIMPDSNAHCPMASMALKKDVLKMKAKYDNLAVVTYINSSSELKAISDVCVTSSNALDIISKLPNKNIYFIPDANLGRYIADKLPDKNVILNDGYCHVHTRITADSIRKAKKANPRALILVHPECSKEVVDMGDYIGSTSGIINYAKNSSDKEFIVCTEKGILYKLKEACPDKIFHFVNDHQICPDMKLINLEKVLTALENMEPVVELDEELREKAYIPLKKMHQLANK